MLPALLLTKLSLSSKTKNTVCAKDTVFIASVFICTFVLTSVRSSTFQTVHRTPDYPCLHFDLLPCILCCLQLVVRISISLANSLNFLNFLIMLVKTSKAWVKMKTSPSTTSTVRITWFGRVRTEGAGGRSVPGWWAMKGSTMMVTPPRVGSDRRSSITCWLFMSFLRQFIVTFTTG